MAIEHRFEDFEEVFENCVIHSTTVQQRLVVATVEEAKEGGVQMLPDCNSGCVFLQTFFEECSVKFPQSERIVSSVVGSFDFVTAFVLWARFAGMSGHPRLKLFLRGLCGSNNNFL